MSNKTVDIEPIILIGAGGHARSCIDVIESNGNYRILGLVGQQKEIGEEVCGYPVLGTHEMLTQLRSKVKTIALGLGQMKTSNLREQYFHLAVELGYNLPAIASSSARVSKHALGASFTQSRESHTYISLNTHSTANTFTCKPDSSSSVYIH